PDYLALRCYSRLHVSSPLAVTEAHTLSLHDALPILCAGLSVRVYMPGRSRTGSSPFSTRKEDSSYCCCLPVITDPSVWDGRKDKAGGGGRERAVACANGFAATGGRSAERRSWRCRLLPGVGLRAAEDASAARGAGVAVGVVELGPVGGSEQDGQRPLVVLHALDDQLAVQAVAFARFGRQAEYFIPLGEGV